MLKNMEPTQYGMNSIHNLSTGPPKRIQTYKRLMLETVDGVFRVILCNF